MQLPRSFRTAACEAHKVQPLWNSTVPTATHHLFLPHPFPQALARLIVSPVFRRHLVKLSAQLAGAAAELSGAFGVVDALQGAGAVSGIAVALGLDCEFARLT